MKPSLILISVALALLSKVNALAQSNQEATADSLLQVVAGSTDDRAKASIYRTLTRMIAYNDSERSLLYAHKAIRHSRVAKDGE